MASYSKRGEFSHQAIVRRTGFPTQTKTFEKKTDAQKWARMVERDMDRGVWQDRSAAEASTLGDILRRYLSEVTPAKKGAAIETGKIQAILRDSICSRSMATLSSMDIAGWRDGRLKTVKGATVNREMAIISHAIDIARKEWGIHVENPCGFVRRCTSSRPRDRRFVDNEQEYLLAALDIAKNRYVKPLVMLSIETAMRRGELLALRWENVDIAKRTAYLPDTKNDDDRYVALSTAAIAILGSLPKAKRGLVFPLSMEAFKQAFVRSCERARAQYVKDCLATKEAPDSDFMTDFRFHDLRHEAASRLFEKGLNVMEVASITGHKTLQMLKRYTHLRAEDLAKKLT